LFVKGFNHIPIGNTVAPKYGASVNICLGFGYKSTMKKVKCQKK
jgi:hypothetical protein